MSTLEPSEIGSTRLLQQVKCKNVIFLKIAKAVSLSQAAPKITWLGTAPINIILPIEKNQNFENKWSFWQELLKTQPFR